MNGPLMSRVVQLRPEFDKREFEREASKASQAAERRIVAGMDDAGEKAGRAVGDGVRDGLDKGAKEGAKKAEEHVGKATRSIQDTFGSMQRFGAKMTLGVSTPLVALGTMAVRSFSSYEDARDASAIFFGDQIRNLQQLEGTAASSLGIARDEVYLYANAFAPLLQQFTNADQLGDRAVDTISRVADAASMFGTTTDEAATAFASFLSGSSSEPIRRYGVFLSEAAVAAIAVGEGLVTADVDAAKLATTQARLAAAQQKVVKLTREGKQGSLEYQKAQADVLAAESALEKVMEGKVPQLTDAQKLQARYIGVMEQTAIVEGNFADTADSTANAMKTAQKEAQNAAIASGEQLAPAVKQAADSFTSLLQTFNGLPEGTKQIIIYGAAIAALVGPMLTVIGTAGSMVGSLGRLAGAWGTVTVQANTAAAAQQRAAIAGGMGGRFGGLGKTGLALGGTALAAYSLAGDEYTSMDALGTVGGFAATGFAMGGPVGGVVGGVAGLGAALWKGSQDLRGLADGGTITRPGAVLVGERGPEVLNLPRAASVIPLDQPAGGITISGPVTIVANDPMEFERQLDRLARRTAATSAYRRSYS